VLAVIDQGGEPALGIVRMSIDADEVAALELACRLARAASIRNGLLGIPRAGAAIVVVDEPKLVQTTLAELLRRKIPKAALRVLAELELPAEFAPLPNLVRPDPGILDRIRSRVLEACVRTVLPSSGAEQTQRAIVLGANPIGREAAAALIQQGFQVSLWDPEPDHAATIATAVGASALEGSWTEAKVDLLVPCTTSPIIDEAVAKDLAASVICGLTPRVMIDSKANAILEGRGRWVVPPMLAASAESIVLADAEGLLDTESAIELVTQTAREVLTQPEGVAKRTLELAIGRSKAAEHT